VVIGYPLLYQVGQFAGGLVLLPNGPGYAGQLVTARPLKSAAQEFGEPAGQALGAGTGATEYQPLLPLQARGQRLPERLVQVTGGHHLHLQGDGAVGLGALQQWHP
jgi:hypothetical protein